MLTEKPSPGDDLPQNGKNGRAVGSGGPPQHAKGGRAGDPGGEDFLIRAEGLSKRYRRGRWLSKRRSIVEALHNVSLGLRPRSTLALIGASGSGKSTLARCLVCLEQLDSGEIWFAGKNLVGLSQGELIPFRRQIQLVFQEPVASLNPRFSAVEIVSEPFLIARLGTAKERRERAFVLMEQVGLLPDLGDRLPSELSGGQRRRLAIARALALEPKLLILDETLAGLDVSTQAQISNLLLELQQLCSLSYLLISHDFGLVTHLADEVAVLESGRIVEGGAPELVTNRGRSEGHNSSMACQLNGMVEFQDDFLV
jgi:peptide/nickel transport system ATP-binding protein/oligopeptide transport system ATP-binding protein